MGSKRTTFREVVISLVLGSLILIVIVGVVEWGGQLAKPTLLEEIHSLIRLDSSALWTMKFDEKREFFEAAYTTNSHGFRSVRESAVIDQKQIVILGASPSFGWGVQDHQTYAAKLEAQWNQQHKNDPAQVVNASIIGASSFQGLKQLDRMLEAGARPKVVVVAFGLNDIDVRRFYFDNGLSDARVSPLNDTLCRAVNRIKDSNWVRLLGRLMAHLKAGRRQDNRGSAISDTIRVSSAEFRFNLASFVERARSHQFRVVFLTIPAQLVQRQSKLQEYEQIISELARREGIPHVDVRPAAEKMGKAFYLGRRNDFIHPSIVGHELIARLLLAAIKF